MGTIAGSLAHWAKKKPNKLAVRFSEDALTYRQFAALCERVRRDLARQLVGRARTMDDIAVIHINSLVHSWPAVIAAQSMGLNTVCVTTLEGWVETRADAITCILLLQDDKKHLRLPERADLRAKTIILPSSIYVIDSSPDAPLISTGDSARGGHFLMTSASTGTSKAIRINTDGERALHDLYRHRRGVRAVSKIHLTNYQPSSASGYGYPTTAFNLGASVIFDDGLQFGRRFYEAEINKAVLYPQWVDRLVADSDKWAPRKCPSLTIHIGGGFVPPEKVQWLRENVTPDVYNDLGSSECIGICSTKVSSPEDLIWHKACDPSEVEIVGDDNIPVPDGAPGSLRIRLRDRGCTEYFQDPSATARAFRNGFFYPGDTAMRRADGRIRLLGRISDVLILAGKKYPVRPFEEKIADKLGCRNAAVFSRQTDDGAEEVLVFIETEAALSGEDMNWVKTLFPSNVIVHIRAAATFPSNTAGKVDRGALRELGFSAPD